MNIYKKLSDIQIELKAPKNQRNTFGNYNYRNAEDILESVKPLCAKHKTTLIVADEMVQVGDRIYVKATATLYDNEQDARIVKLDATAYARESETKKGMDASQITGSTSSYARKYALNGLFNIDDTKDADFTNKHGKEDNPQKYDKKPVGTQHALISEYQKDQIVKLVANEYVDLQGVLAYYKVSNVDELNFKQANAVISKGNKNKGVK